MTDSLATIGTLLQRYILPFIILIGTVGNVMNVMVLTRPALNRHACSRYFLALAFNNLFYSFVGLINRLLSSGYQLDPSDSSLIACKVISYINTLNAFLSPYFIVLASIDRYCASSTSARIRKFSDIKVANWSIVGVVFFYSLFFIHIIVLADLHNGNRSGCLVQANTTYSQVYILIQVFLFAIVPPACMATFGLLTIHHSHRTRIIPIAASRFYRTEKQLAQMLFFQVGTHIFLTFPASITYLIQVLPNTTRSTTIFIFISAICQLLFNFSYTTPFFSYLLSGSIYRRELLQLLHTRCGMRRQNQVQPTAEQNTTGQPS